ncbi:hypothetical protein ACP4OV_012778 [Aristida adscensionis]
MNRQSKRTCAPAPAGFPPPVTQVVTPPPTRPVLASGTEPVAAPGTQAVAPPPMATPPVLPPSLPFGYGPGAWLPPLQAMASSSAPSWFGGLQQAGMPSAATKGPWSKAAGVDSSACPAAPEHPDVQAWGLDSHPPGGFLNFLKKNTQSPPQAVCNGSPSHPINVGDGANSDECTRTEKRLSWTKEEDLRLVSAWLNNSNDPIQSNYKKNDQYWNGVAAVYNSTTPKNRARLVKQIKDRFARIKKRVAWFCGSWKEANALWASGESDVDLMERALKTYEEEHKKDGPFMFKHCWDVLRKEPKWDAYLERLDELDPDKRKFNVNDDVGHHFCLDDASDERPIGGKQAKERQKRKRKKQENEDLEDELHRFVDLQNTTNEGRKEVLETQRRVSSEKLEGRKLAYLAAKEQKESTMLETYRSLLMQDTTGMPEDMRSEHIMALKCLREKLFSNTD